MAPIDPRILRAKRYPLHAAVDRCNWKEVERLCEEDAEFHVVRKVSDWDIGVLHSACSMREIDLIHSKEGLPTKILEYLIKKGTPVSSMDTSGATPLHYAVCSADYAYEYVSILLKSGKPEVNAKRNSDGWTPLFLAVMLGRIDLVEHLLDAMADPDIKDIDYQTTEQLAIKYRFYNIAGLLRSPRKLHRPKEEPIIPIESIVTDEMIAWRDSSGNTLLHLAAWNGNKSLCKKFFDSKSGRQLINFQNCLSITPLAMAIFNGKKQTVEDFFMNKEAKSILDITWTSNKQKENYFHLFVQYLPTLSLKLLLRRKDFSPSLINAVNSSGYTPLLYCSKARHASLVKSILDAPSLKDHLKLDIKSSKNKNILHYLIESKDEENFNKILDRKELTEELANSSDDQGNTALLSCLKNGSVTMAKTMLTHPRASTLFKLDLCFGSDGKTPLHFVAEQGNFGLWETALSRPSMNMNAIDSFGNTPLMQAALKSRSGMIKAWLTSKNSKLKNLDLCLRNKNGLGLLEIILNNNDITLMDVLLEHMDTKGIINEVHSESTLLSLAIEQEKWEMVKVLLNNKGLKVCGTDNDQISVLDIHKTGKEGSLSPLASVLVAQVKLERKKQTFEMKKQNKEAEETNTQILKLSEIVSLLLQREKEIHGSSVVQGRDGGSTCIKNQIQASKLLRSPIPEDIISQYVKFFQFIKFKKKKSIPCEEEEKKKIPKKDKITSNVSCLLSTESLDKIDNFLNNPELKKNSENFTHIELNTNKKVASYSKNDRKEILNKTSCDNKLNDNIQNKEEKKTEEEIKKLKPKRTKKASKTITKPIQETEEKENNSLTLVVTLEEPKAPKRSPKSISNTNEKSYTNKDNNTPETTKLKINSATIGTQTECKCRCSCQNT